MTSQEVKLFCILDGASTAFGVFIALVKDIDDLKKAIKDAKDPELNAFAPDMLILWRVAIADEGNPVHLENVESKTPLIKPTDEISEVFGTAPAKKTIHVIVRLPAAASELPQQGPSTSTSEVPSSSLSLKRERDQGFTMAILKRFKPNSTVYEEFRKTVYYADQTQSNIPLIKDIVGRGFVRVYGSRASGKSSRIIDAMRVPSEMGFKCI
ncbi:hypothetical protein BGZ46_004403, partial [Entomortierella lignicola]